MPASANTTPTAPQASDRKEPLRNHLIKGVLGTGGLGIVNKSIGLLTAIVLAKGLGADGYGYYAFAIAAVSFIAIPTQLGLPQLLTREIAASHARREWGLMHGMRLRAIQLSIVTVVFSLLALGGGLSVAGDSIAALDPATFALTLVLLPLWVAMALANSVSAGLRRIIHASWPNAALQPAAYLLLLLALQAWVGKLDPPTAVIANIIASLMAFLVVMYLHRKHWPSEAVNVKPSYQTRSWMKSLAPFTMLAGIHLINQKADILMLGAMTSAENVGIYNVAIQGSMLVSFALSIFNGVLAPNVARLNAQGAHRQLQRLLTLSTVAMSITAAAIALILLFAGEWLLELIFGASFSQAYTALLILIIGQLINATMGSVGLFLIMTGHEKETLRAVTLSALLNVVLNALLIPKYGIVGAASATTACVVLWNILLGIQLYRRLNLIPGPLVFRPGPPKESRPST